MKINELEQLYEVFVRISGYITYEGKDGSLENFTNAVIEYIDDKEHQIIILREIIDELQQQLKDCKEELNELAERTVLG